MSTLKQFPEIMRHAHQDLGATVSGRFSPEDWQKILERAEAKWRAALETAEAGESDLTAWQAVIRDFHRERYWGYQPNYQPPKAKGNLGTSFIWVGFITFTLVNMSLAWLGQRYTTSDEPRDGYIFFAVLAFWLIAFAAFLWRQRKHRD
ncbi:MAG: hypothetical protein KF799_11165 [Bdellovibrionales bacterium]|nr:hypothetical protein [Bdellovibrionales bacterium]